MLGRYWWISMGGLCQQSPQVDGHHQLWQSIFETPSAVGFIAWWISRSDVFFLGSLSCLASRSRQKFPSICSGNFGKFCFVWRKQGWEASSCFFCIQFLVQGQPPKSYFEKFHDDKPVMDWQHFPCRDLVKGSNNNVHPQMVCFGVPRALQRSHPRWTSDDCLQKRSQHEWVSSWCLQLWTMDSFRCGIRTGWERYVFFEEIWKGSQACFAGIQAVFYSVAQLPSSSTYFPGTSQPGPKRALCLEPTSMGNPIRWGLHRATLPDFPEGRPSNYGRENAATIFRSSVRKVCKRRPDSARESWLDYLKKPSILILL